MLSCVYFSNLNITRIQIVIQKPLLYLARRNVNMLFQTHLTKTEQNMSEFQFESPKSAVMLQCCFSYFRETNRWEPNFVDSNGFTPIQKQFLSKSNN